MKILLISANYPPDHKGGYELRIREIVEGLEKRGHSLKVLTTRASKIGIKSGSAKHYTVLRRLHYRRKAKFFPKEVFFDILDLHFVDEQIEKFKPDLVYLGHIYPLSKALLPYLYEKNVPLVVDEGGASLKGAWTEHGRWFRFTGNYRSKYGLINKVKPFMVNGLIKLSHQRLKRSWSWPENLNAIINNDGNLRNIQALGIPLRNSEVIHSGINIEKFDFKSREKISLPVKLIYPARIELLKNQGEAIMLVAALKSSGIQTHLTLIGPIGSDEYFKQLTDQISDCGLEENISFKPMISQKELVAHYQHSDILFFPTMHEMGFSRVPLEGMACGCVVITYGNEASDAVIENGANGYIVRQKDFPAAVSIIQKLAEKASLVQEITQSARRLIEQEYSLERYISHVEDFIISVVADA